jgi:hypothetical protein
MWRYRNGHGGICRYFADISIRKMERDFGREPSRRMSEFLGYYHVEASDTGQVISMGRRYVLLPTHSLSSFAALKFGAKAQCQTTGWRLWLLGSSNSLSQSG